MMRGMEPMRALGWRPASKGGAMPTHSNFTRIVTPGAGVITPPEGARSMRVALVGPGGPGSSNSGGSGGGCAATKIVAVQAIEYFIGSSATSASPGISETSTANFPGYSLVATGGRHGGVGSEGGVGSGGDYNYSGGARVNGAGGGAAGPAGNGGSFNTPSVRNSEGWGEAGGGGGNWVSNSGSGGGGVGAPGGARATAVTPAVSDSPFGRPAPSGASSAGGPGGEMGGGGGGGLSASIALGGVGGIVVEWFY